MDTEFDVKKALRKDRIAMTILYREIEEVMELLGYKVRLYENDSEITMMLIGVPESMDKVKNEPSD